MQPRYSELTFQQELFANEYVKDYNGTQAAIRAGYSANSAEAIASRLLRNVKIFNKVEELKKKKIEKVQYDSNRLLSELVEENHADTADLFDEDGKIKPIKEWPVVWRKGGLITNMEVFEEYQGKGDEKIAIGRVVKIKFSEKIKRKEMLGKHVQINAFKEIIQHDATSMMVDMYNRVQGATLSPKIDDDE